MQIQQKLDAIIRRNNSLVCVGLDSDANKIPEHLQGKKNAVFEFNKAIVDATHDLVSTYKPNSAFYEANGDAGIRQLKLTCDYLRKTYPEIIIILDAKRGDIGSTNDGYVQYAYDWLGVDMITIHPYFGYEALKPFFSRADKGAIVLCRSSNPGGGEFQDLPRDALRIIPDALQFAIDLDPRGDESEVGGHRLTECYQFEAPIIQIDAALIHLLFVAEDPVGQIRVPLDQGPDTPLDHRLCQSAHRQELLPQLLQLSL